MRTHTLLPSFVFAALMLVSLSAFSAWTTIDAMGEATARHESGMVAHKGKIYVLGGRGVKPVEIFDPLSKKWQTRSSTPFEMHHITPISSGDKILVVTGFTGKFPAEQPLTHIWEYDPELDIWSQGTEIPELRRRGAAGVTMHKDKVYIVGGAKLGHTSGTSNMMDVYDPANKTWNSLTDAPHIRDHSNAVILDNYLIAIGGRNTSYHEPGAFTAFFGQVVDEIDVYNFDTQQWHSLKARLPIPSAGAGAAVTDSKLFYVGGESSAKLAHSQMVSFDLSTQSFNQEAALKRGRHGTNMVVINGKLYIGMGSGNRGGRPELNSIEVFELD